MPKPLVSAQNCTQTIRGKDCSLWNEYSSLAVFCDDVCDDVVIDIKVYTEL